MRKLLSSAIITSALLFSTTGASAAPIGLAQSPQGFELAKGTNSAIFQSLQSSVFEVGDTLTSAGDRVRIAMSDGVNVLIEKTSSVSFFGPKAVSLNNGSMVVSQKAGNSFLFEHGSLAILPAAAAGAAVGAEELMFHVKEISSGVLEVTGVQGTHLIQQGANDIQTAILGAGDRFRLVLDDLGTWNVEPLDALNFNAATPLKGNTIIQNGALVAAPAPPIALFWWGAAATTGGIGFLAWDYSKGDDGIFGLNDDDDDNDEESFAPGGGNTGIPIIPPVSPTSDEAFL